MSRVAVLGSGSWGTTLAVHLANAGHEARIWGHPPEDLARMEADRENQKFLPGIMLPDRVKVRPELEAALEGAEYALFVVPSQVLRSVARQVAAAGSRPARCVCASKGLELGTRLRLSQVLEETLTTTDVVVLTGPSHAEEVSRGIPTSVVAAAASEERARDVQVLFSTSRFRVYTNTDVAGCEIGAALKNVIAIAAGVCDGVGFGDNTKGALLTRGLAELSRLGVAMGRRRETRVHVTVFSRSALAPGERNSLEVMLRCGLGAREDLAGFYQFARKDPILFVAVRDLRGMRSGMVDDVFGAAVLAILLQMAPMTRSDQMMSAFLEQYGNRIEFDETVVTLWPRPEDISGVDPDELRRTANLGYRAKWIVRAAQYLSEHPISLLKLSTLPAEESTRQLMEIPGIGKYSAGIILGQATLPIDAWSVVIMSELFMGHTPVHPREEIDPVISELTAKWGRWSWLAFVYVLNDLENLAKIYTLSRIS